MPTESAGMRRGARIDLCSIRGFTIAVLSCGFFSVPFTAAAQDRFAGAWKIEKTEPAPWAPTPDMTEAKEIKRLTGAAVEFKPDRIDGPDPLACKRPHYEIKKVQADELFQGALAQFGDTTTSPDKLADRIGFGKRPIPTLDTGCASGIDFHALDADHLIFALNNSLYRMVRASAATKSKSKP